jgi:uncharacterized protein (AIM24 family)
LADVIDYNIFGNDMQVVEIELDAGEGVRAEAGAMLYMDGGIEMQTSTGGGLFKGFKRMLTGESFFITTFLNNAKERRKVAFAAPFPGRILPVDLGQVGGSILCQKDSFLCAARALRKRWPSPRSSGGAFRRRGLHLAEAGGQRSCFHSCRRDAAGEGLEIEGSPDG